MTDAIAYMMTPPAEFEAPPSEAYLCAIWRMLRESHGAAALEADDGSAEGHAACGGGIPLLRMEHEAGVPVVLPLFPGEGGTWRRPAQLLSTKAVLYEAGAAARPPWELPRAAAALDDALHAAGVRSAPELLSLLRCGAAAGAVSPLRAALAAAGRINALSDADEAALLAWAQLQPHAAEEVEAAAEAAPASS